MRSFIDTNVLVYADAGDEPAKQTRALALICELRLAGEGLLSTQVLQEFANVALRKLGLPPALVRERLAFYAGFEVVPTTPDLIQAALDLHVTHGLSFYDALIAQAAMVSGCARLCSEDFQAGRRLGKLLVENPFASA
ncbi:PIN domain-containing protein [Ideonella sp. DXS22W]|uniref:Ribonuclease VapC n=1 Tax=Pseudaquabacterium inlustre TaxID=2984192 RepID=A0ABU9CAG5_9BURK